MHLRRPVVIVAGFGAPPRGQLATRCIASADRAAEHAVARHAVGLAGAVTLIEIGILRLVEIPESALRVVDFTLEEIALGDHGEVQSQARADDPAPRIARM